MTNGPADKIAKRAALWASAFLAVATALGFVNKWFIADPIVAAVSEERVGRITADSTITTRLENITVVQAQLAEVIISNDLSGILRRLDALETKKGRP